MQLQPTAKKIGSANINGSVFGIIRTNSMGEVSSVTAPGGSAGKKPVERLLAAIGYPERMSGAPMPFTLRVDGMEVSAEETADGRILLLHVLTDDDSMIPTLAGYAAGRMLVEDAVLAYGAQKNQTFLWQDAAADADARELVRFFETFMDSCEWWRDRVKALRVGGMEVPEADSAMVIRP